MMIAIAALALLAGLLFWQLVKQRQALKQMLEVMQGLERGEQRKLYSKGSGLLSQVSYQFNSLMHSYHARLAEQKKIEQANKELMTSLSHDVRTPLASLLGYLDALEDGVPAREEQPHYISVARKKAHDLNKLVDTLFDWFKIDSNAMVLSMRQVDLAELVRQTIIEWLPVFEQHSIELSTSLPEQSVWIELDEAAAERIISNVIHNAIVHSQCTSLHFSLEPSPTDERGKQGIQLIIADNGIGMDEQQLQHIFERLYKADSSRSRHSSGLGLWIAKQLCEMQGGTIEAASKSGAGSTFTITFSPV